MDYDFRQILLPPFVAFVRRLVYRLLNLDGAERWVKQISSLLSCARPTSVVRVANVFAGLSEEGPVRRVTHPGAQQSSPRRARQRLPSSPVRGTRYAGPSSDSPPGSARGRPYESRLTHANARDLLCHRSRRLSAVRRARLGTPSASGGSSRAKTAALTRRALRAAALQIYTGRRGCPLR